VALHEPGPWPGFVVYGPELAGVWAAYRGLRPLKDFHNETTVKVKPALMPESSI